MEGLLPSFTLGLVSAASPCLLPLYPGFVAYLSGNSDALRGRRGASLLGAGMLAGVLTALVAVALVLNALAVPSTDLLRVVVPLVDGLLILLGVLLISGRNPFERLPGITVPVVRNPLGQAYLYGLLLGPVALPCAGPFVLALLAISVGIEDTTLRLGSFLVYGLGFGAPLVLLSFVAAARRQALMGVVLRHHEMIMWLAGVALVGAGLYDLAATIRSA